jgi:hypothetical protein
MTERIGNICRNIQVTWLQVNEQRNPAYWWLQWNRWSGWKETGVPEALGKIISMLRWWHERLPTGRLPGQVPLFNTGVVTISTHKGALLYSFSSCAAMENLLWPIRNHFRYKLHQINGNAMGIKHSKNARVLVSSLTQKIKHFTVPWSAL